MFVVDDEALVEVIFLACVVYGAQCGEDSLGHDLAERDCGVVLRHGVFMVLARQNFVGSEDFLAKFPFLAIQGDIVVGFHELVVDTGGERLGNGVLVCRRARCGRRRRRRRGGRCSRHDAGLVLHLDDLVEDDPRCGDGVRIFGAQLVVRTSHGDPGDQLLYRGLLHGVGVLEVDCNGAGRLDFDGLEVRHHGACVGACIEVHSSLLFCHVEVGVSGDHGGTDDQATTRLKQ